MIYAIIRIFLVSLLVIIVFSLLKRKGITSRTVRILVVILAILALCASSILPVENVFISFPTLESAFNYHLYGDIVGVAEGNDSCLVIYKTSKSSYSKTTIPKATDGYKVGTFIDAKKIAYSENYNPYVFMYIYNARGTSDYYLYGYASVEIDDDGNDVNLSDSLNSDISCIYERVSAGEVNSAKVVFYAFIDELSYDYYVMFNDTKLSIRLGA